MASSKAKKAWVAAVSAVTMAGTVAMTVTPAEAWHRGRSHNRGGAVAAGVVGGLALGALAAGAARPAYGAPVYGAAPVYDEDCYVVRRRYVDAWGRTIVRRETVCE